ncbi:MAG TPA: hypothetical protein PKD54_00915 [Pirellulaceae bacterium]|nr:hypothetical protein [Pirellulaceae bacterium]
MSSVQRNIRRIQPASREPLESQFWPVAIALLATSGLAIGAISALLEGPWLWGSLLALPVLVVAALIALHRLRNRWFRRSMQLGVLVSLATHLLVMIVSSAIDIFGGPIHRKTVEISPHQPSPTLIVSQRDPQPIWETLNLRQTPDPVLETHREPTARTQPSQHMIDMPQSQPATDSQVLERRNPTQSVPRQDVSLAQRRRNEARQPTETATSSHSTPTASVVVDARPSESTERPSPAESRANALTASANEESTQAANTPVASQSSPLRRESPMDANVTSEQPLSAKMRSSQAALPQASAETHSAHRASTPAAESPVENQTRDVSASRAASMERAVQPAQSTPLPQRELNPTSQATRQPTRDASPELPPTWSQPTSTVTVPRRAAVPSESVASHTPLENPALATEAREPTPSRDVVATSHTRGSSGGSSAAEHHNLQPTSHPSTGLASAPSDSASQRRAENRVDPQPTLTAMQRPQTSGRQTGNQTPQSAWQANTTQAASISANTESAARTTEASAANLESASRRTATERATEQGLAQVDIGATKLMADSAVQRHSGGGHAEPNHLNTQLPNLAARSASGGQPTLDVAPSGITQTPMTSPSAPSSSNGAEPVAHDSNSRAANRELRAEEPVTSDIAGAGTGANHSQSSHDTRPRRQAADQQYQGAELAGAAGTEPIGVRQPSRVSRAPSAGAVAAATLSTGSESPMESSPLAGPNSTSSEAADHRGAESQRAASRNSGERSSIALDISADLGPAGLANDPRPGPGTLARPAARDVHEAILDADTRFRRRDAGGTPNVMADANLANEAFRARIENKSNSGPTTEAAIELGLEFLARYQRSDGSWSLMDFDQHDPRHGQIMSSDMAATGLAVLAFQGAGYTHRDFKYAETLARAIDWLIKHQGADGRLFVENGPMKDDPRLMYSHAIATLALTEAYGMTQDPQLREPIDRALQFIATTQDRQHGGWRYYHEPDRRRTDTSVTGWMMMALQSARLADLHVPDQVWLGMDRWLGMARDADHESRFRYDPFADASQTQHRVTSPSMTSVGLLMRLYTGWDRKDPRLVAGGEYLLQHLPGERSPIERDTYYWYYATQVLRHLGGDVWDEWNRQLHPLLVNSQIKSGPMGGSWDPYGPVPDRWGHAGGRLYVTTMNLLSLEVNYRLLPLYERSTE